MQIVATVLKKFKYITVIAAVLVAFVPAGQAFASTEVPAKAEIYEAQGIMNAFGIPNGPQDGLNGPNTGQGLCIFRTISGMPASRKNLDSATLLKLREYKTKYTNASIPAPTFRGKKSFVYVYQTCQALIYVNNQVYVKFIAASTGSVGHETPNGDYVIGDTVRGWTCSTIYTETCRYQTAGQYANYKAANGTIRNYGNMYNKRAFKAGGFYVHGSNTVPTNPGSGGCIRISVADADWFSQYVPTGTNLFVTGKYNEADRPVSPAAAATPRPTLK